MRKLLQPWHGPYRIVSKSDPDVTLKKIYYPEDQHIPKDFTGMETKDVGLDGWQRETRRS